MLFNFFFINYKRFGIWFDVYISSIKILLNKKSCLFLDRTLIFTHLFIHLFTQSIVYNFIYIADIAFVWKFKKGGYD